MTINLADNSPRVSYAVAAGVTQSSFTVSFEFFEEADLNVYVDGTLKTLTTDYTVSGGDGSTGSVAISVTGASGGSTVVITRSIALERTTDFPSSGPFDIASLNTELDKVVAIAADLKDRDDRALKLTDYDSAVSLVLPDVDTRKGKVLAFNTSTGAVEAGPAISDTETIADIATDIATLADIEDGTDATDAIQTVSGISSDVTTVSGISSNVTTVAGISADVTTVAGDTADIGTVAGISANVSTVAGISSDVTTAAGISSNITTVAGDSADIQALAAKTTELGLLGTADAIADMNTLATSAIVTDLDLLADVKADIESLGDITANITTVAGISANVTTVAGISANTTTVAGISSNVTSVAGISSDVTTVAGQISPTNNIATVAGNNTNITTVAGNNANISTVAGISSNITTVAGISSDVTTVAGDSADIQTVAANIGTISTKANAGANSDITSLSGLTTALSLSQGGTGATTASAARTSLGLGTIATQASDSVSITGGSVTGITDIAVADGGTGASDAATARTNLGLVIGTDVQAYDADTVKKDVNNTFTKAQRGSTNTDTSNTGSVTLDFGTNQNFVLTLTGNVTLANPSTESTGQSGFIIFIQDSTGSRTVSLGTDYETAGAAGLTLSTAASSVDIVPYVVQSSGNILLGTPQLAFS